MKRERRPISSSVFVPILVVWVLLCAAVGPLGAVELTVGRVDGKTGKEVELPITVRDGAGLEGLQFVLAFDPAGLENTGVEVGPIAGAGDIDQKVRGPGRVRIALLPESTLGSGEGILLNAKFRVLAEAGAELQVGLEEARASEFREGFPLWMQVNTTPGAIRAMEPSMSKWLLIVAGVAIAALFLIVTVVKRRRTAG